MRQQERGGCLHSVLSQETERWMLALCLYSFHPGPNPGGAARYPGKVSSCSRPSLETPSLTCPGVPLHGNSEAGQLEGKIHHHFELFFSFVCLTKGFSSVVTARFT